MATALRWRALASRMYPMARAWSSCVPCEKLRRATSMPAAMRASMPSGVFEAGPMVHTIFARREIIGADPTRHPPEAQVPR